MDKYRKKPVVIEAVKLTRANRDEVLEWANGDTRPALGYSEFYPDVQDVAIYIKTLEGEMRAGLGDWIIKGVKGEFYPCKPDIFEATYEPVEGE